MTITCRPATLNDITDLTCLYDSYRVFYKQDSDTGLAQSFLTARLENDESFMWLAFDGAGAAVGFMQMYPIFSSISAKPALILNDLYVDQSARGLGVGKSLLDAAKEFGKSYGAAYITLSTAKTNVTAQRLYVKEGYKLDDNYLNFDYDLS